MTAATYREGMSYEDYLNNLKSGDEILYVNINRYGSKIGRIVIERRTATQIVTTAGERFRAKDGLKLGGTGYRNYLPKPAGEAELAALRAKKEREDLIYHLEHMVEWGELTTETLQAIAAMLPKDTT